MINICAALHCEAKPFIARYGMKRQLRHKPFQVFEGERARLVVTGTGGVNAGCGVAYLLASNAPDSNDIIINIGTAGSVRFAAGTAVACNKAVNAATGKVFYPEMIWKHPFAEGSVATHVKPVSAGDIDMDCDMADMECGFFYEAALFFMPAHRIHIVKIVSDNLDPGSVTKEDIEALARRNVHVISEWMDGLQEGLPERASPAPEESAFLDALSARMKLSQAMDMKLRGAFARCKDSGADAMAALAPFSHVTCHDKRERNAIYADALGKLAQ